MSGASHTFVTPHGWGEHEAVRSRPRRAQSPAPTPPGASRVGQPALATAVAASRIVPVVIYDALRVGQEL